MIQRPEYIEKLKKLRDKNIIKVITGVRRCGKSTLLEMYQKELLDDGVSSNQIQSYNFEDPKNLIWVDKWTELYQNIIDKTVKGKQNYIFLDEIQNINNFERLADGLFIRKGIDLYITGSNAYFLSQDIATILSGRMFEIKVFPLSFSEFISTFEDKTDLSDKFEKYTQSGGMPLIIDFNNNQSLILEYLQGIYNTVHLNDVLKRPGVNDKDVLKDISSFMLDNIGNITTAKKIADTLTSKGRAISHSTVEKYISALADSLLFYSIEKIGLKGRKRLYSQKKFYAVDIGFRQLILSSNQSDEDRGHLLENIVYLELVRRHLKVNFGKVNDKEVDFVVLTKEGYTEYYQVSWSVRDKQTYQREISPLDSIKDHNTKYLLTIDPEESNDHGIRQKNVINWLLDSQNN